MFTHVAPVGVAAARGCGAAVRDGRFRPSKSGLAFWAVQLALQTWTFVRMGFYLGKTLAQRDRLDCSKDNYCTIFGILLTHSVISPVLVSLVLLRLPRSVRMLNATARLLLRRRYPRGRLSVNTCAVVPFSLVIIFKLVTTVMSIPQKYPDLYYPYFTAYMVPIVSINLVGVLCVVTQQSYEDINRYVAPPFILTVILQLLLISLFHLFVRIVIITT